MQTKEYADRPGGEGAPDSVDEAIRQFGGRVHRLARSFFPREAEDAAQAVFLQLYCSWESRPRQGVEDLMRWIYRVAYNCLVDMKRRAASSRRCPPGHMASMAEARDVPDERCGADPKAAAVAREVRKLFRSKVHAVPDQQRVVLLARLDGVPRKQIAQLNGLTESRVRALEEKAFKAVRAALMQEGVDADELFVE